MTQQPFSRPGAIDLSGLGRPAAPTGAPASGPAAPGAPSDARSYSVVVDEQGFQGLLEQSVTAPVLLAFYSRTRMPESGQLADDRFMKVSRRIGVPQRPQGSPSRPYASSERSNSPLTPSVET